MTSCKMNTKITIFLFYTQHTRDSTCTRLPGLLLPLITRINKFQIAATNFNTNRPPRKLLIR